MTSRESIALMQNGKPTGVRVAKVLSQSDKDEILGLFPGGISHTQVNFGITEFGFTAEGAALGGIGFSVNDQIGINLDIPEGYLKMLLDAFPTTGGVYTLDNTAIKASWLREYNLSYARMSAGRSKVAEECCGGCWNKICPGLRLLWNGSLYRQYSGRSHDTREMS